MGKPGHSRRIVALAAAYAVALQVLLLPLSVAAGSPLTGSLCAASGQQHSAPVLPTGCACAAGCGMQCCFHILAGQPPALAAVAATAGKVLTVARTLTAVFRAPARGAPLARAPPIA